MYKIELTEGFRSWLLKLRDRGVRARIDTRIERLSLGDPGDARFVGEGVLELKINYGPGYRVYCMRRKEEIIPLLAGGDNRTQVRDIRKAIELTRVGREAE
jgi:putative addiction module killer protein